MSGENWMPGGRHEIIAMARVWIEVISVKAPEWHIPAEELSELEQLTAAAETILAVVEGAARTQADTARCNTAFDALKAKMRFIKERWFRTPPLLDADYYSLLIRPKDTVRTPVQRATSMVEGDICYPNPGMLELQHIRRLGAASADPRSEYKVQIRIGVEGGTGPYRMEKPPERAEDLPVVHTTRRRTRDFFNLTGNSGKRGYLCMCWLNPNDEPGPWGPVIGFFIP